MRGSVLRPPGSEVCLGDIAEIRAPASVARRAAAVPFGRAPEAGGHRVISVLAVLDAAQRVAPGVDWRLVGQSDAVVEATAPLRRRWLWGIGVWLLLFIGAATTLLNFHADVNMPAAHRELYRLATGRSSAHPFAVEVPYAIGVGLGALLFFAAPGWSGRDPGPLELEAARYRRDLRAYRRERRGR